MKYAKMLVLAGLVGVSGAALATTRAVTCDGCSPQQMSEKAAQALDRGTVWVFDATMARVGKYAVFTEVVDTLPYSIWKQAIAQDPEPEIVDAWASWVTFRDTTQDESGPIQLPPGFPIRSVGGALLDPDFTSTHVEDFLRELNAFRQTELVLGTLISYLVRNNVPWVDLKSLLRTIKVTIVFPDGSSLDYSIAFSLDAISGEAIAELEPAGNARMANGQPAPTGRGGFDGFSVRDDNGSLQEWILWAQHLGLVVSGASNGTTMTCAWSGDAIYCKVTKKG